MGTTCAFKISGSLIKPTRETLLDYCSYTLIVLAFIGILRVIIGGSNLRESCNLSRRDTVDKSDPELLRIDPSDVIISDVKDDILESTILEEIFQNDFASDANDEDASEMLPRMSLEEQKDRNTKKKDARTIASDTTSSVNQSITSYDLRGIDMCPKYYQAVFAYVLLIESMLLFLSGMLWVKAPRVNMTLIKFAKLVHFCQESDWANQALKVITNRRINENFSQSLYSIISSECMNYDMRSLLDTLFHPDSEYRAKAKARHLYERVQTFCHDKNNQTDVWKTYIMKSIVQFALWIIIFNINLVLFVLLQFYVKCSEDPDVVCDHDEFLRIVWFMAETIMLIFGFFNFKNLKWINEKAVVRKRICCCCVSRCFDDHVALDKSNDAPMINCRAYRYDMNQPVHNDMALLLHLLEEAHPKVLPYFVVFMFDEWKEKLTSFAEAVNFSEPLMRSSIQMLSGRPLPIIEITDLSVPRVSVSYDKKPPSPNRKPSVTFCVGSESELSSENEATGSRRERNLSSGSHSSLTVQSKIRNPISNKKRRDSPVNIIKIHPPKGPRSPQRSYATLATYPPTPKLSTTTSDITLNIKPKELPRKNNDTGHEHSTTHAKDPLDVTWTPIVISSVSEEGNSTSDENACLLQRANPEASMESRVESRLSSNSSETQLIIHGAE